VTTSRQRYQKGSLLKQRRAGGAIEWVLRYRTTSPDGRRVQRQAVVGSTKDYRTESQAQKAADQLRVTINSLSRVQAPTVGEVTQHFKQLELAEESKRRSWATKQNYREVLGLYILPRWENVRMTVIKTIEVENWLTGLKAARRKTALANATKQRIRNVFSVLFTHAQRYEFVLQGLNPITLVRQSGKRRRAPDILSASEVHALWNESATRERAIISLEFGNGLRIGEAMGLKWADLDLKGGTASVNRSMVKGKVGDTKTEVSAKLVPLHQYQIDDLEAWHAVAPYGDDSNWVFASHLNDGLKPYWPDMLRKRHLVPTAERLGIKKQIGWHTFRRTYASLLKAAGTDVKVVQELLRHSNISTTMNLYVQAFSEDARQAQSNVIEKVKNTPFRLPFEPSEIPPAS
jgi:integrase